MVDWGTIELELIIKLSDSRFIEPTHINVVYDNEAYKVEFDEVVSTIDVKRNLGKFKLKRPYVKILSASRHYLRTRQIFCDVSPNGTIIFNKNYGNILCAQTWIRELNKNGWIMFGVGYLEEPTLVNIAVDGKMENDITDKQWKCIFDIEKRHRVCFEGKCKQEASQFIGKWYK